MELALVWSLMWNLSTRYSASNSFYALALPFLSTFLKKRGTFTGSVTSYKLYITSHFIHDFQQLHKQLARTFTGVHLAPVYHNSTWAYNSHDPSCSIMIMTNVCCFLASDRHSRILIRGQVTQCLDSTTNTFKVKINLNANIGRTECLLCLYKSLPRCILWSTRWKSL